MTQEEIIQKLMAYNGTWLKDRRKILDEMGSHNKKDELIQAATNAYHYWDNIFVKMLKEIREKEKLDYLLTNILGSIDKLIIGISNSDKPIKNKELFLMPIYNHLQPLINIKWEYNS